MSINSYITDSATGRVASVRKGMALSVGPPAPSESFNALLGVDNTVVNVVPAMADNFFVLTGLMLTGNKNINTNVDAVVEVYVADTETTAAADAITSLILVPVARSESRDVVGILIETPEGKWINAVTSDDDVFVTALGYYVKVES